MRCTSIRFNAFRRLAATRCNTDTRILAFVGSNEAGKSSVLAALSWLTGPQGEALASTSVTRQRSVAMDEVIAEAVFRLDDQDIEALRDLQVEVPLTGFLLQRRRNGSTGSDAQPVPTRQRGPFTAARDALIEAGTRLVDELTAIAATDDEAQPSEWIQAALQNLERPDEQWEAEGVAVLDGLCSWLESNAPETDQPRDEAAARTLRIVLSIMGSTHPAAAARSILGERMPRFMLFTPEDRVLATTHEIGDEGSRNDLAPSLRNLLRVAHLDVEELWTFAESGDVSSRESLIEVANENLEEFFAQVAVST